MMFNFARDCALEVSYETLGDALLGSCEAESTHRRTHAHSPTCIYIHTKSHKWDPTCLPRIEGSFSAYISRLSLGITLLESHWFMPAVRFMRKNRAIESQHGADLSRVGRNDNAKGRDEVLLNEMDWKKKKRKAKQDGYRSTAETQL